jgi:hypothetical protein
MAEHILTPIQGRKVWDVTAGGAKAGRLHVEGFSPWQRRWLMALIAVQVTCQKLLLVDGAIAVRKMIERRKRIWAERSWWTRFNVYATAREIKDSPMKTMNPRVYPAFPYSYARIHGQRRKIWRTD